MSDTVRQNARGELSMSYDAFRRADYGQICRMLGLRPSRPHERADGTRALPRRRRRGRAG